MPIGPKPYFPAAASFGGSTTYSSPVRARINARRSVISFNRFVTSINSFFCPSLNPAQPVASTDPPGAAVLFSSSSRACSFGISRSINIGRITVVFVFPAASSLRLFSLHAGMIPTCPSSTRTPAGP